MISKRQLDESEKLTKTLVESIPFEALKEKERNASDEEKAKIKEIKEGVIANLKSGGKEGALKYLRHIRPQL